MKTPKPGRLPPPIPKDAMRIRASAISPAEQARFIQESGRDYDRRFGDSRRFSDPSRSQSSVPYVNLVLPEIMLRAKSLPEVAIWDKSCKDMVADFIAWGFGRHSDHIFGILAPLVRKVNTLAEIKIWDGQIKMLIADYKDRKLDLRWCYTLKVLPELIERSASLSDLRTWDLELKGLLSYLQSDNEFNLRSLIPKLLSKAQTVTAFRQWYVAANLVMSRSPEIKDDLLFMIDVASAPEELKTLLG